MQVTSVEPQQTTPHRFNIFIDGKFVFGADEDLVVNHRLVPGKNIDQELLEKLLFEAEMGELIGRVYALFNIRQRSEKEVRDYLKRLSFKRKVKDQEEISDLVIELLIERLIQKGMINDKAFAIDWVDSRRRSKKKGVIAIKMELYQKGIDQEIINDQLSMINDDAEEKLAEEVLEKKLKSLEELPYLEKKKKIINFLLRRGFEYSIVKRVVEKMINKDYN